MVYGQVYDPVYGQVYGQIKYEWFLENSYIFSSISNLPAMDILIFLSHHLQLFSLEHFFCLEHHKLRPRI